MSNESKPLEINFTPSFKQDLVFQYIQDKTTTEILFGGSAGGGKSFLIASVAVLFCLQCDGIRVGLARHELTTLKRTTLVSFWEVVDLFGIRDLITYRDQKGEIEFSNGSKIILLELSYNPSDPEYTRLGGQLLTFALVDELGEAPEKGYTILKSRVGRWLNDEFNIKAMIISTCNPIKNWIYREFYEKDRDGTIEDYKVFIPALVTDNPYISKSYIQNLERLPLVERERLLYGNWDYENNPNQMLDFTIINSLWDVEDELYQEDEEYYLTVDIGFTSDRSVYIVWRGLDIIEISSSQGDSNPEKEIKEICKRYPIKLRNVAYDSDGVGKFIKNYLSVAYPIVNNSRALRGENYENLKTQLYYKLVEMIELGKIRILTNDFSREIKEELAMIRSRPTMNEGKLSMVRKGDVKRLLGRSPDFTDAMAYRMVYLYHKRKAPVSYGIH